MRSPLRISMKITAAIILLAVIAMSSPVLAQNYENFDNLTLGSTPGDGSFMGKNMVPWYYYNCRGDVPITGKAITLGVGGTTSSLTCYQMPLDIQSISFDLMQVGPEAATVFVLVNNVQVGSRTTSVQNLVVNSGPISIDPGGAEEVVVTFITVEGGKEVTIDNIAWTVTPGNVETFDELNASSNEFGSGNFIGVNMHTWEYYGAKKTDGPDAAIILEEGNGQLSCSDITTGMYSFNFDYVQSNDAPVYLEIRINGEIFTTISSDSPENPMNTGEIIVNQAGGINGNPLSIEITVAYDDDAGQYGGEVTIDNFAWTDLSYRYTDFTGTGNWDDATKWSNGIPDANSYAFIKGDAILDAAVTAHYVGVEPAWSLTVSGGELTAETFTIRADATGSGSFLGSDSELDISSANMEWHITSGVSEAWHLLSSPVPNQGLTSNSNQFTPTGNYPDGSGYDFYAWDEPTEMWLNRKVSANNINSFVPGKGYLVAYQDISANKIFGSYTFNSGTITVPITGPGFPGKSSNGIHAGSNLIGNPYPSSIDWKSTDLNKNNLINNNGYMLYIWNDAFQNYGTYSSGTSGDGGTLGVGRFIPPLQGFFVMTQGGGSFVFNDGARVHSNQLYLKSGNEEGFRLSVQAPESAGKDEILLDFGHEANQGGADKWYSMSDKAPSLWLPSYEKEYSIRFFNSVEDNPLIPVAFKAGVTGEYSISAGFNTAGYTSVKLKDLLNGNTHDLSANPDYTFTANVGDDVNRFVLVFGTLGLDNPEAASEIQVYVHAGTLYLNSSSATPAEVKVYNLTGQLVMEGKAGGNTLTTMNAAQLGTGVYLVNAVTDEKVFSRKVVITK